MGNVINNDLNKQNMKRKTYNFLAALSLFELQSANLNTKDQNKNTNLRACALARCNQARFKNTEAQYNQ
jgi:hypothetical protein